MSEWLLRPGVQDLSDTSVMNLRAGSHQLCALVWLVKAVTCSFVTELEFNP